MLQRIQTIFMLLSVLAPVFLIITGQDVNYLNAQHWLIVPCVVLVLLGAYSIFSFKNRKKQLKLNLISMIINVLLVVLLLLWLQSLSGGIHFPEKGIEPLFPFIAIVCLLIANYFIRKDERLVKSVDRLR